MCRLCDGASWEEVVAERELQLAVYGYFITGVRDEHCDPWLYTVGLLDAIGHRELIVAGPRAEACAAVLHDLAERVLAGEEFAVGDKSKAAGDRVTFGAVDVAHYADDTFNQWHEMQRAGLIDTPELEAVQVVLAPDCFCIDCQYLQPVLSNADARVGVRPIPPNRAARRRSQRRGPKTS